MLFSVRLRIFNRRSAGATGLPARARAPGSPRRPDSSVCLHLAAAGGADRAGDALAREGQPSRVAASAGPGVEALRGEGGAPPPPAYIFLQTAFLFTYIFWAIYFYRKSYGFFHAFIVFII